MDRHHTIFTRVNPPERRLAADAARARRQSISEYIRALVRKDAETVLGRAKTREIFQETARKG